MHCILDNMMQAGGTERHLGRYGDNFQSRSHPRLDLNGDGEWDPKRGSEN